MLYISEGGRPISYIDHCLLSSTLIQHVNKCEVLDDHHLNFSDHLPVSVHLSSLSCVGTALVTMTEPAQSKVAWTRITSDDLQILYTDRVSVELEQLRREYGLTSDVVCVKEDILDSLIDRILWILRESAAKLPQAKYRKFLKPYWNKGLSECKKIVKAHWHEWVSNGRPIDDTNNSFASYKAAKRCYRNAIHEAEREYELRWAQDILKSSEMDHKVFWWMVNRRKRSRTGSVVSPIQTESGIKHEPSEIVDVWADHFRLLATPSVGEECDNDFKAWIENGFQNLYAQSFRNQNNFLDTPLQAKEVSAVLKKMHLGKAGGLDGCVPEHFRYGGPVLEDLLLLVFRGKSCC